MALTPSTMLPLGTSVPHFSLQDTHGKTVSLNDFKSSPALLVIFMCNHCPYVKHIRTELAHATTEFQRQGVAIVGINANDAQNYPEDSPAKMKEEAQFAGYTFAYLFDETQAVAKSYKAACTPEFYLFDQARKLVYRGEFDDSRPNNGKPVTGKNLRAAVEALLAGKPIASGQQPGIGCNIKWKPGNEPSYFAR